MKYTIYQQDKGYNKFLRRDGEILICPYSPISSECGAWCPLFREDKQESYAIRCANFIGEYSREYPGHHRITLHCASTPLTYEVE